MFSWSGYWTEHYCLHIAIIPIYSKNSIIKLIDWFIQQSATITASQSAIPKVFDQYVCIMIPQEDQYFQFSFNHHGFYNGPCTVASFGNWIGDWRISEICLFEIRLVHRKFGSDYLLFRVSQIVFIGCRVESYPVFGAFVDVVLPYEIMNVAGESNNIFTFNQLTRTYCFPNWSAPNDRCSHHVGDSIERFGQWANRSAIHNWPVMVRIHFICSRCLWCHSHTHRGLAIFPQMSQ